MPNRSTKKKWFYRGVIYGVVAFILSFLCLGANLDAQLTFYLHTHGWNFFLVAITAVSFIIVWCAITVLIGIRLLGVLNKLHIKIFGYRDTNLSEG